MKPFQGTSVASSSYSVTNSEVPSQARRKGFAGTLHSLRLANLASGEKVSLSRGEFQGEQAELTGYSPSPSEGQVHKILPLPPTLSPALHQRPCNFMFAFSAQIFWPSNFEDKEDHRMISVFPPLKETLKWLAPFM